MILEPPLAAYFLPDFSHLPPLGQHQLSLDLRDKVGLVFAPMEGSLTGQKITLGEIRQQTLQTLRQMSLKHFGKGGNISQQMNFCPHGSSELLFTVL